MKHRLDLILVFLLPAHFLILGAGFFSPYDPDRQIRELAFAPPTPLHWRDWQGKLHVRPFVYGYSAVSDRFAVYQPDRNRIFPLRFFVSSPRPDGAGGFHSRWRLFGVEDGGRIFLLGTDQYGRDQLSRLLYGAQVSLLAGLAATAVSLGAGWLLGSLSGFYAGWFGTAIMRLADLFLALPWLYLLFAVRAFLPLHTPPKESFFILIAVVGGIGWARPARLIRGTVLSAKERNYVLAARGFGAGDTYLMRRHVLPQTFGVVLTQAGLLMPQYIVAEVALSYVGLGLGEPIPSLGTMLSQVQVQTTMLSHWWMLLPGIVLIPLLAGYFGLSDALHERAGLVQT